MRRRLLLAGGGLLAWPWPARALDDPDQPIRALAAALLANMRAGRASAFAARAARLRPVVERVFDLEAILRASLGPRFAEAVPELLGVFTEFTVATWTANFDVADGETIEVDKETRAIGNDRVVASRIVPRSGEATRLDYVMRLGPPGWRAVDILLNGTISRVAVQRSDFRGLLAAGGAERLAEHLRARAASLARGEKS